jgi:hypothetical protein
MTPTHVWDGHSCPSPLTLILICHPEEAESHPKRAIPDEGSMHLVARLRCPATSKTGKGAASAVPKHAP